MSAAITFRSAPSALDTRCGRLAPGQYVEGILAGERGVLSRFITLLESKRADDRRIAQRVLTALLPHSGRSIRVGITGVPGAGKSTLIESLGLRLIGQGHRVAVLAIDPTSRISGGSILGDKTRMIDLSRQANAFYRKNGWNETRRFLDEGNTGMRKIEYRKSRPAQSDL